MSDPEWIDLCALNELEEGSPALKKADGLRVACVRRGDEVHAVDDRCPHQGYPLSQGTVRDGVLTCAWHNWKFELATGRCSSGGDAVRRHATRIEDGRVKLELVVDPDADVARATLGLREALFEGDVERAVREGLRLGAACPGPGPLGPVSAAFAAAALDAAERAPHGFGHDLAAIADLATFAEDGRLDPTQALATAALLVGELSQARPPRAKVEATQDPGIDLAEALATERRGDAEAAARRAARKGGIEAVVDAMSPFVTSDLLAYGHGVIYPAKALELGARFPGAAEEIAAALVVRLGWATADTRLPSFAATRRALDETSSIAVGDVDTFDRPSFERAVLEGEKSAVLATLALLRQGIAPRALLLAAAHAAAERVLRFDRAWEGRLDADAGLLDVTHALTFAEAAHTLAGRAAYAGRAARLAVIATGFVGKLRRGDGAPVAPGGPGPLQAALTARDLARARGAVVGLDRAGRAEAFRLSAPFATLEAFARPIFIAHGVKLCEALRRLDAADLGVDDTTYLDALLAAVVPRTRERSIPRIAAIATAFLGNGRPPESLY